jgi:hypothetical protein
MEHSQKKLINWELLRADVVISLLVIQIVIFVKSSILFFLVASPSKSCLNLFFT